MQLAQNILNYYFDHSAELPIDKQFHFATRIAAWLDDERANTLLKELRPAIIPPNQPLTKVFTELLGRAPSGMSNAHERRAPYFAKYPTLNGVHLALFRLRHLLAVYGIDARQDFFAVQSRESLNSLCNALLEDEDALRILSTFAVNTIYLTYGVALQRTDYPTSRFLEAGTRGYDTDNMSDIQLLIYLYTHCIIGASNFYTQVIPDKDLPVYANMLERLEAVIGEHFDRINLDNKLEYLVCTRICDVPSMHADRIYAECEKSVSKDGMFIVDTHNQNGQTDRMTFEKSEHRNVLYIMSATPYTPHPHQQ